MATNATSGSLIGQRVIVRTYSAGVHYGTLQSKDGKEVTLANSRWIWKWVGAFTLNEIALNGITNESKLSAMVPVTVLPESIQIIPVSPKAARILDSIPNFKP